MGSSGPSDRAPRFDDPDQKNIRNRGFPVCRSVGVSGMSTDVRKSAGHSSGFEQQRLEAIVDKARPWQPGPARLRAHGSDQPVHAQLPRLTVELGLAKSFG